MNERIIALLSQGYDQTTVASAVGCTDGYISQLLSDETLRTQIAGARVGKLESFVSHDNALDEIEDLAIAKMRQLMAFVSRPRDAVMMFQAVNNAKRKAGADNMPKSGVADGAPIVQLNISGPAAVHFRLSGDKQVIEVEGRSMATMSAKTLNNKLAEKQAARPLITDESTADQLLSNVARGITHESVANVL